MVFSVRRNRPGLYICRVNNFERFQIKKDKPRTKSWVDDSHWSIRDISREKTYSNFVSLREAKDFIKNEILK